MVAMNTTETSAPLPTLNKKKSLHEKLSWTFGGITAASGGAVFLCDQMATSRNKTAQQILGAVLAFWIVFIIRTLMTYVWGLGMPKEEALPAAAAPAVADAEDESEGRAGSRRRRTRTRRDD